MADTLSFDLIVIGAGPGGYIAALRAAQLGLSVACIEKEASPGGTCLNVGCIPSKALLHSSELFEEARSGLAEHGIRANEISLDLGTMLKRKDRVVTTLTRGIAGLFRKAGTTLVRGTARLVGGTRVAVMNPDGEQLFEGRNVILASGSVPIELPGLPFDHQSIVDSTDALTFQKVPASLIVVGAGAIGLELGSVWRRLGSQVTVVELTPDVTPGMDREMSGMLRKALQKQGLRFHFDTRVESAEILGQTVRCGLARAGGESTTIEAERVLVAVGRRAFSEGLGLAGAGVATDERGRITVDAHWQTSVDGIFAIGDVIAGPMLAHKAEEEAVACVERIAGIAGHVRYDAIPAVVYTYPEFAAVGLTEEQALERGLEVRIGRFPFAANARARTMGEIEGAVKMIADANTDRVLGVHVVGPRAADLIAEATLAMHLGAAAEDIARSCHAHPTLPEALKEAALAVAKRTLNA